MTAGRGDNAAHLGGAFVDEDVVKVSVAQADEVAGHGVDGCRARVRQPLLKPRRRLPERLQEEIVQARREARTHLHAELGQAIVGELCPQLMVQMTSSFVHRKSQSPITVPHDGAPRARRATAPMQVSVQQQSDTSRSCCSWFSKPDKVSQLSKTDAQMLLHEGNEVVRQAPAAHFKHVK